MAPEISCVPSSIEGPFRSRILTYIRERRCPSGGYCFYRLDEPNAGDTYYALRTLSLLGEEVQDNETGEFLRDLQNPDGSYSSYAAALFAGRGLRMLGKRPSYLLQEYIDRSLPSFDPNTQVIETFSLFDPLLTWVSLHLLHSVPIPDSRKDNLVDTLLGLQAVSGGFGLPVATLLDTWQASEALVLLGYPPEDLKAAGFLHACEDPEFGYLGRPGTRPPYLEHLYAGLRLSAVMETPPRYPAACRSFLERCTHRSGGFVRSIFGGSPTLEFTALAVESLAILDGADHPWMESWNWEGDI